jgi:ribose transport system substrate-binding protein
VTIVGFVAVPEARQAIKDGKIYADVIQKPTEIGLRTITAIKSYVSGQQVPPAILIPCGLYTQKEAEADEKFRSDMP